MTSNNFQKIRKEIEEIAIAFGRDPTEIQLVAVTKNTEIDQIRDIYQAGARDFGENRVQDALAKIPALPEDAQWHFIGPLQMNKVRKVVGAFSLIHSVDSVKLIKKISEVSVEKGVISPILLEVNTSGEPTKHGFSQEELIDIFFEINDLPGILIEGLMTMAPFTADTERIRSCFASLHQLKIKLGLMHLSMGMSNDYPIAIAEGATILRIGTALFEP